MRIARTAFPSAPAGLLGRATRVLAAATIGAGTLVGVLAAPAGAVVVDDWAALGWNSASGTASPQSFTDVGGSGVGMSVAYGSGMWDNGSVPNVYGGAAPVSGLTQSLRFTNDISGAAAPVTLTFTQAVQVNGLTIGSLSQIGTNYEWVRVQAFDASNALVGATTSTSRLTTASPATPIVPGATLVQNDNAGTVNARGTGRQELGEYDQVTLSYGSTPVQRIVIEHTNRTGPLVTDPPAAAFSSVVLSSLDIAPAATRYDLGLTNVLTGYDSTSRQATFRVTVCNQGDVASGAVTVGYVLPAGMTYVSPSAVGARTTLTVPGSLAVESCATVDIVALVDVGSNGQLVTAAEIVSDSGDDVDSAPSVTPAVGTSSEDDRTVAGDAALVDTDPSEDDRDIAVVSVVAVPGSTTTTTPPTTTPPTTTTPTTTPPTTPPTTPAAGPAPTGVTLPATGPAAGMRNPAVILAAALMVAWFGAVVARRGTLLGGRRS